MRHLFLLLLLGLALARDAAGASPLLNRAAEKWLAEDNHWAFTARVREFDRSGAVKEVRVERYDPSRPGAEKWTLQTVNGAAPTPERLAAWRKAKAKKLRHEPRALAGYFDFDNARVAGATSQVIHYVLPVHSTHEWLLPLEGIVLTVTVNRAAAAITEVKAGIDEPFRAALGLARILEVNFNLKVGPATPGGAIPAPAAAHPAGVAEMVLSRLGARIEYGWTDFQRVTPAPAGPAKPWPPPIPPPAG